MSAVEVGKTPPSNATRDAIHSAIAPVTAACDLDPGEHVGLVDGDSVAGPSAVCFGIVDPFLTERVKKGDRFWLFLYQNSVTSLAHHWTHPAFSTPPKGGYFQIDVGYVISRNWLDDFANKSDMHYDELMDAARSWMQHGDYQCDGGKWEGHSTPDEFWNHYEVITGTKIDNHNRGNFFTCSC